MGVFSFLSGILIPFFNHTFIVMNLLKMQVPYSKSMLYPSVYSLFGDDLKFAFLCADFGRRTFYFLGGLYMSKRNRIFIKTILLILLLSIGIVSTSCSYVKGGYNYLFNKLSDAEWQSALSVRKFHNVTIADGGYPIKIVNGIPYNNDEKMQDDEAIVVEIILGLIKNCKYDDFTYDYKKKIFKEMILWKIKC